jgi:curved DNA-binding protein
MQYKDYYKVMGVERGATQDEMKRAFRKLARKYHPDVSKEPDAEERFKEVNEAYEVLRDPEKRAAYDQLGSQWHEGQEFRPPPDWAKGFDRTGAGFTQEDTSGFSDFFEELFGGVHRGFGTRREGAAFRMRGQDVSAQLHISLEDAYHGASRTITLDTPEIDASGQVRQQKKTLNVRIPRGVRAGQMIRLGGQGGPGIGEKAPAGDLYLQVEFDPHPLFHAEEKDIFLDLPITPWEAALGAQITVPTLGGRVDLSIPAGSQTGRKLRLKGRGLPGEDGGDQYVVLRIETPPADTEAAKELYRKMAKDLPYNPRKRRGMA